MGKRLKSLGLDLAEDRHLSAAVLSDPAPAGPGQPYRGIVDNVRTWTDATGTAATVARFVRHRFSPHTHDTLMLGLIEAGSKEFRRERHTHAAHAGSVSIVNPGDLHTGCRLAGAELRYRALYVPADLLAEVIDRRGATEFASAVIEDREVYRALLRMHEAIVSADDRLAIDAFSLTALNLLVSRYAGRPAGRRAGESATAAREVARARALIEERFADDLPVAQIARSVGMSAFHLMRQFRRHTGVPIHAYQLQTRIERSKRLLAVGRPPSQVALDVGFADQSHFTKRFKRIVGASPALYQRDMRADGHRPPLR